MAPEIYDECYGPGCDIYSFGMSVLEMVTQKTPYHECQNVPQIYKKVISGQKPMDLELIEDKLLHDFILVCLLSESERPTAEQLQNHPFLFLQNVIFLLRFLTTDSVNDNQPVSFSQTLMAQIDEEKPSTIGLSRQVFEQSSNSKNQVTIKSNVPQSSEQVQQQQDDDKDKETKLKPLQPLDVQQSYFNSSQTDPQTENNLQIQQQHDNEIKSEQRDKSSLSKATQNSENETLQHLTKIIIQNQLSINDKNSPQQHSDTSESNFNSSMEHFENFYNQYLTTYYFDYLQNENEEQMEYRHKIESIMLKKLHILQKEHYLKQSQFSMQSGRMMQTIQDQLQPSQFDLNSISKQELKTENNNQQAIKLAKNYSAQEQKQQEAKTQQIQEKEPERVQITENEARKVQKEENKSQLDSSASKKSSLNQYEVKQEQRQESPDIKKSPLNQTSENSKGNTPTIEVLQVKQSFSESIKQNQSQPKTSVTSSQHQQQQQNQQMQVSPQPEQKGKEEQKILHEKPQSQVGQCQPIIKQINSFINQQEKMIIIDDANPEKAKKSNQQLLEILKAYVFSQPLSMKNKQVEDIKILQLCLNELLPDDVVDNGHFGHYTEKLVKQVQKLNGEKEDGVVDQKLWDKIKGQVITKLTKPVVENKSVKQCENENKLQKIRNEQNKMSKITLDLLETEMINNLHLK